jgi:flagellin
MGAFQANSLESNLNYLRIARENVIGSESVIRDADMADEMMQNTRNQIMLQSSTAMLVQANQNPQRVLQLLG